uniref:SH3 domain-binding glutamic acid-rich-like protein 3 n=1 Tax=Dromaius novaehollandiae TaxID=8790 RepID=A0A8C4KPU6_DRONO
MGSLKVYCGSVTGSRQRQAEVRRILDGNRLRYELIDVPVSEGRLREMREKAGDPQATPPQICNGDEYCGVGAALPSGPAASQLGLVN